MRQTAIHPDLSGSTTQSQAFLLGDFKRVALALALRFIAILDVSRERQQLASLDDRMLKDIGLSRSMVDQEASRSPFDLPFDRPRLG